MQMTEAQRRRILEDINQEGFDYTFLDYSDYRDIGDAEFHHLRQEYLSARHRLARYLGLKR